MANEVIFPAHIDMDSTRYLNNPKIKRSGVPIEFTEEQITEYIKCKENINYFSENYIKVVHVDKGLIPLKLHSYQKDLVNLIDNNRFVCCRVGRQSGKCFFKDTNIVVKNKKTGEIKKISAIDFYDSIKNKDK